MPLALFSAHSERRLGKVIGDEVVDLTAAKPELPRDVKGFLAAGERAASAYRSVDGASGPRLSLSNVTLHAPIPDPEKFLAIGMNYRDHAKEAKELGIATPGFQVWFNKQVSCVNGPYDPIVKPYVSDQLDYECELAVVIGRTCRHVAVADAAAVIGGYMVANDVSVRDWQLRTQTMTLGKSFDTHGPVGPWLTLPWEIDDPHALRLRTLVNGEVRQDDTTANLIHNIFEQIAYLSTVMTLKPGDILLTGTPSGVGVARKPPVFLKVGDVVRIEIDGLGHIENEVAPEA